MFFYGWWDWRFLGLLGFTSVVDYIIGIKIHESTIRKKLYLISSLIINLSLLGFFKYYNFFISSIEKGMSDLGFKFDTWTLQVILPVGISFYTFQTLSYSIDIYKGKITPSKSFVGFAAFVSFFPQLVAGPIERASTLLPQFNKPRTFNSENAINGITLIVYGFFKKLVIADRLALYVNVVFEDIDSANTTTLIIATVFFSFQIYCDFSAYSLIARGVAKLFGFELMVNFKRPYLSASITEFWRKWHISLSTWFRDYLYIPLGGNRVPVLRNYFNLITVFLVSGIWHGANWTFVFWGLLHGVFQVFYLIYLKFVTFERKNSLIRKVVNIIFVYFLVCFSWVFFRATSIEESFLIFGKIVDFELSFDLEKLVVGLGPVNLALSFLVIILLFISYLLPENLIFKKQSTQILFNITTIILIILLGVNGESEFIYFQF